MLALLVSVSLASIMAASAAPLELSEPATTACMRDLNSYLESQLAGGQEPTSVRDSLELVSYQLKLARDNPQHVSEQITLLASAECNTSDLLALIESLREASSSEGACDDQVSMDFLMIVANYELTPRGGAKDTSDDSKRGGRPLNEFARDRVDACWQAYVLSVSRGLERTLGKLTSFVFGFVEAIARQNRKLQQPARQQEERRAAGALKIKDSGDEDDDELSGAPGVTGSERTSLDLPHAPEVLRAAVDTLKQLKVDTSAAQRANFAEAVYKLYESYVRRLTGRSDDAEADEAEKEQVGAFFENNFVQPCNQLVERVQSIVARGQIFKGHTRETLGQALANEKRSNARLDYELQVFRICKLANAHASEITHRLKDLARPKVRPLFSEEDEDWFKW